MAGLNKSKSSTKFDPAIMEKLNSYIGDAKGFAASYKPFEGNLSADTTPAMQSYFDYVGGEGKGLLGASAEGARSAMSFAPSTITAPGVTAAQAGRAQGIDPSRSLGLLGEASTAAGVDRGSIRDVNLGAFDGSQIKALMNPYESDVVRVAQDDFERQRMMALNADASTAAKAGAFGNTGFGVQKALTSEGALRASDAATAGIRHAGWETAGNLALGARGQDLTAAQGNQQADLGVAGMNAETGRFNAGQGNEFKKFGAGLLGDFDQFNAGEQNKFTAADADRRQDASTPDANNQLKALTSNQDAGIRAADLQLKGAGLLGDQAVAAAGLLGTAGGVQQGLAQGDINRQYQAWQDNWDNMTENQKLIAQAYGFLPDAKTTKSSSFGLSFDIPAPPA